MTMLRRLAADRSGSALAEFTMVLPFVMILIFGTIDAGRWMWQWNRLEKATQAGARMAVVTDVLAPVIASKDYVGVTVNGTKLSQGDRIPSGAMATVTCTSTACTSSDTSFNATPSSTTFDRIVTRMKAIRRDITADNVTVIYSGSSLGFAGNPSGPDLSPLVTVKVSGLTFRPITGFLFMSMTFPDRGTTLSAEDLTGSQSN